jgi:ABC-2 type transport system ATP-binding protein
MWDLVRKIRDRGTTVFLTTHYMDEAEILCDRVAIMDRGKIVRLDRPATLIAALLSRGFSKPALPQPANLEDVFLDLTGRGLREE